ASEAPKGSGDRGGGRSPEGKVPPPQVIHWCKCGEWLLRGAPHIATKPAVATVRRFSERRPAVAIVAGLRLMIDLRLMVSPSGMSLRFFPPFHWLWSGWVRPVKIK